MAYKILRLKDVIEKVNLSRSTIYAKLAENPPTFPRPMKLGARSIGFLESEIDDWIAEKFNRIKSNQNESS